MLFFIDWPQDNLEHPPHEVATGKDEKTQIFRNFIPNSNKGQQKGERSLKRILAMEDGLSKLHQSSNGISPPHPLEYYTEEWGER